MAYDRRAVYGLLRDWSSDRLRAELDAGSFGAGLGPDEAHELRAHLTAWLQRALGPLALRDAVLIDRQRGERVFSLLCGALTAASAPVPDALVGLLPRPPAPLAALPPELLAADPEGTLGGLAGRQGLALAVLGEGDDFPFPDDLLALAPGAPPPFRLPRPRFEQPTGWRRRFAVLLAAAGVTLLALPLIMGQIPDRPAGMPLALLTLALLVGIRAGPAGFAGSLCIWLVANLPGFRHGSAPATVLWPALPLMAAGLGLLALDRRVRGMWRWLRALLRGARE